MIGTSLPELALIKVSIAFLRAVTPLSVAYCIARPFFRLPLALRFLDIWPISETAFFFLVYLPWRKSLQGSANHPPPRSREDRRILFKRCQENLPEPEKFLSKWFRDAPSSEIKSENVKEFYRWAFLDTAEVTAAHEEELDEYVQGLEKQLGRKLEPGRGKAKCLRLTLDEVDAVHRPLIWFLAVFFVDNASHLHLMYRGFHHHSKPFSLVPSILPARPLTVFTSKRSPVEQLSYWYRPHRSKTRLPVLFLHGIGIGLYPYVPFLAAINKAHDIDDDVGIIAIEILPVSFRLTHKALSRDEMCRQIHIILLRHDVEKFVLISHSYGSVISTHLLHAPSIAPQIASVILVDPVSILLHLPDVAYNFTYREPRGANQLQLWYFASKDLFVAHTLSRSFFWSENILWKEDMIGHRVSIFLSGRDLIVNTPQVWRYLTGSAVPGTDDEQVWTRSAADTASSAVSPPPSSPVGSNGSVERQQPTNESLRVSWYSNLDHAQVFDSTQGVKDLVSEVRRLTKI
ncbi:MAG: hypothetical protein M1825_003921 [Sarcosagium campestre]|nr:MAG: hypothetical protein M1825_003921 [Sarcosagium campestre]